MAEKKKYNSILVSGRKDQTLTYSKYIKDEETGESVKESLDKKVNVTDKLETQQIKDGAITNEKMAADSVSNTNLQDGSVSNEKLDDGSITNDKLAKNSITKDKLKDNTIGVEKLDPELRQTINAATGLPEDLVETIQNVDDTLKDHQSQLDDKQSQIDDKQQQITANDEDISLLQTRSTQMEETIKGVAATGGASQAAAVTYDNANSQLKAINIQSAVDEVVDKGAKNAKDIKEFTERVNGIDFTKSYSNERDIFLVTNTKIGETYTIDVIVSNVGTSPISLTLRPSTNDGTFYKDINGESLAAKTESFSATFVATSTTLYLQNWTGSCDVSVKSKGIITELREDIENASDNIEKTYTHFVTDVIIAKWIKHLYIETLTDDIYTAKIVATNYSNKAVNIQVLKNGSNYFNVVAILGTSKIWCGGTFNGDCSLFIEFNDWAINEIKPGYNTFDIDLQNLKLPSEKVFADNIKQSLVDIFVDEKYADKMISISKIASSDKSIILRIDNKDVTVGYNGTLTDSDGNAYGFLKTKELYHTFEQALANNSAFGIVNLNKFILNKKSDISAFALTNGYKYSSLSFTAHQEKTSMNIADGAFQKDPINHYRRYPIEKGKKYAIVGKVTTGDNATLAYGQYDGTTFNNYIEGVPQSANTTNNYAVIVEGKAAWMYVIGTLEVFELSAIETELIFDTSLSETSINAVENQAIYKGIRDAISSIPSSGQTQKSATITIASSNSSQYAKDAATFVCTGSNDDIVINSAIQALPENGGEIHLCGGLFITSNPIVIDRNIKISGEGQTIASRPEYTPTNGRTYINMYGKTDGGTTIRIEADKNVIEIGDIVKKKLKVSIQDLFIQGYGKDRSSICCGIYARSTTDISYFKNVSICECLIGGYFHGDKDNSFMDAMRITDCSFQWCGCGLVVYGVWNIIRGCTIADNNGIDSFTDLEGNVTTLNTGGLYLYGKAFNQAIENIIVRTETKIPSDKTYYSVVGQAMGLSQNQFSCNGNGIYVYGSFSKIENNTFHDLGVEKRTTNPSDDIIAIEQSSSSNINEFSNNRCTKAGYKGIGVIFLKGGASYGRTFCNGNVLYNLNSSPIQINNTMMGENIVYND